MKDVVDAVAVGNEGVMMSANLAKRPAAFAEFVLSEAHGRACGLLLGLFFGDMAHLIEPRL